MMRLIPFHLLFKFALGFGIGIALSSIGFAAEKDEDSIEENLRIELAKRFARAKIEFLPGSTFPVLREGAKPKQIRILSEAGTGTADYSVSYSDGSSALAQARFSAMVPTFVALKRIRPGDKLSRGDFQIQSVNVAQGLAYQYRAMILSDGENVDGMQARQTILEGQYPLMSGVEKIPDVRRGDTVQVRILSGDISLSTMGIVQEPGYFEQNLRVLTQKTKKELVGQFKKGGVVEVAL